MNFLLGAPGVTSLAPYVYMFLSAGQIPSWILFRAASLSKLAPGNWRLHPQLSLEGPQRRVRVVGPIAPGGASQAILEEHASGSVTT